MNQDLLRIDENQIRQAIAQKYDIRADDVSLYHDYKFVRCGDEKIHREFIYGIIDLKNKMHRIKQLNRYDEGKMMEELVRKIELILIEEGQHNQKFRLDEEIRYSPYEVRQLLLKHKDDLQT